MFKIDPISLKIYRDYTYERSSIYYKKEILNLAKPWTDDEYLRKYKFTCHRRELDRQSKFLIETVINNPRVSYEDKILNCFIFRLINHDEGTKLLKEWPVKFTNIDLQSFKSYEDSLNKSGMLMQSNAYFLSHIRTASRRLNPDWGTSQSNIVFYVNSFKGIIVEASKLPPIECIKMLQTISSIGNFMGYQIWVDFTYMEDYHSTENDYVISGPGCDHGIDWMLNSNLTHYRSDGVFDCKYGELSREYPNNTYEDFIYWFNSNLPLLMYENNLEWSPEKFQHYLPVNKQNWGLMQIENSFCEFNKLMKLKNKVKMRIRNFNGKEL